MKQSKRVIALFLNLSLLLSTRAQTLEINTQAKPIVYVTPEACQSARELRSIIKVEACPQALQQLFNFIDQDVALVPLEIAEPALLEMLNLVNDPAFPQDKYQETKRNLEEYAKELNSGNALVSLQAEDTQDLDLATTRGRTQRCRVVCDLLVRQNLNVRGKLRINNLNGVLQATNGVVFAAPVNNSITLSGDVTGAQDNTRVVSVCNVPACDIAAAATTVTNATPLNIPNTLVLRDGTGSFAAQDIIVDGDINLTTNPSTGPGAILKAGQKFLHNPGVNNTALGLNTLENSTTAESNTALGSRSLRENTTGTNNTAAGAFTLQNNTTGVSNTAFGTFSLLKNTNGLNNTALGAYSLSENQSGYNNTAVGTFSLLRNQGTLITLGIHNTGIGAYSLARNTKGRNNTALGFNALGFTIQDRDTIIQKFSDAQSQASSQGNNNTAIGTSALTSITTASSNIALGVLAGNSLNTGSNNTFIGNSSADLLTDGSANIFIGDSSGRLLTSGSNNTFLGNSSGQDATTGDNNIYINNGGNDESGTIRIGTQGTQTATYIAGVYNGVEDITTAQAVYVDANGQLGTAEPVIISSRRFKEDIEDMGNATSQLLSLRPVTFKYKQEINKSGQTQYGLIAEEVAELYPHLVSYDKNGQVHGVKYELLNVMLLNELKKQALELQELKQSVAQLSLNK